MDIMGKKHLDGVLAALCVLTGWGGVSAAARAASFFADFNGDGINDSATVTACSGAVCTSLYPTDGAPPTYANGDGVAGLEAIFHTGLLGTVWVVDRTRRILYR